MRGNTFLQATAARKTSKSGWPSISTASDCKRPPRRSIYPRLSSHAGITRRQVTSRSAVAIGKRMVPFPFPFPAPSGGTWTKLNAYASFARACCIGNCKCNHSLHSRREKEIEIAQHTARIKSSIANIAATAPSGGGGGRGGGSRPASKPPRSLRPLDSSKNRRGGGGGGGGGGAGRLEARVLQQTSSPPPAAPPWFVKRE